MPKRRIFSDAELMMCRIMALGAILGMIVAVLVGNRLPGGPVWPVHIGAACASAWYGVWRSKAGPYGMRLPMALVVSGLCLAAWHILSMGAWSVLGSEAGTWFDVRMNPKFRLTYFAFLPIALWLFGRRNQE